MYKLARTLTILGTGLSVSAVVGWLLLRERKRDRDVRHVTIRSQYQPPEVAPLPEIVLPMEALDDEDLDGEPAGSGADDLTNIHDIGPRFAAALAKIGITRFSQLAERTPDQLAAQLAPFVTVRAHRIQTKDWIGQAARLAIQKKP
jgi:predicted flap endonuclease-1-like 5' DNA nuclease